MLLLMSKRRRKNPSENDWAYEQGVEYGEAVAKEAHFDRDAALAYMRENWRNDLHAEAKTITQMKDTDHRAVFKSLLDGIAHGVDVGILAHEEQTKAKRKKRTEVIDLAPYEVKPHPPRQAPKPPQMMATFHRKGERKPPWQRRWAYKAGDSLSRGGRWLEEWGTRSNPSPDAILAAIQNGTMDPHVGFMTLARMFK